MRDLRRGTTSLVSVNAAGTDSGNELSHQPQFSPDGRRIVFESRASDLGPTDTNGDSDLYLRDLARGKTTLVSHNFAGTDSATSRGWGSTSGGLVAFSPDGSRLAYSSRADGLARVDTNGRDDVFVHDIRTGTNRLVSANATGTAASNGHSYGPQVSPNGRSLAFASTATGLGPPGAGINPADPAGGAQADVFVRDLRTGRTTLVTPPVPAEDEPRLPRAPLQPRRAPPGLHQPVRPAGPARPRFRLGRLRGHRPRPPASLSRRRAGPGRPPAGFW